MGRKKASALREEPQQVQEEAPAQAEQAGPPLALPEPLAPKARCPSSKRRFPGQEEAAWAAREGMLDGAPPLSTYWCLVCSGWHLTSSPGRLPMKRRRR